MKKKNERQDSSALDNEAMDSVNKYHIQCPTPTLFHYTESPHSIYFPVSTQIQAGGPQHVLALYRGIDSDKDRMKRLLCISPGRKTTSEKNQDEEGTSDLSKKAPFSFLCMISKRPFFFFSPGIPDHQLFVPKLAPVFCPLRISKALDGARTRLSPPCDDDRLPRS